MFASNAFENVLKFFDKKELLEFRKVSAKMADELVPRCFQEYRYSCADEEDEEDYQFLRHVKNPKKLIIRNICGTEAHLQKIE